MADETTDTIAVTETVIRSFTTADAKDFDAYRSLMADQLTVDFGGVNDGGSSQDPGSDGSVSADEQVASARQLLGPVGVTHHQITNVVVEVDGDQADVSFYEQALHHHAALGDDPTVNTWVVHGRGTRTLRRFADGWKIVHAGLDPVHVQGNPNFLSDVSALG